MNEKIDLSLSKEDVNKYLTQLILESGLGDFFKSQFAEIVNKALTGWNSPIEKFVKHTVFEYVEKELEKSPYKELILNKIKEMVTEDMLEKIISEGMYAFKRAVED